jgi:leader peptidase (prepilin peptidase) / N-methyltransferase
MIVLVLVMLGLVMGSFINALTWRMHIGKDWVRGRSECSHCHHPLAPKDLVPVLSWISLLGKCRYCHHKIEDSPLIELAMPAIFVFSYYFWPLGFNGGGLFEFVLWLVFLVGFGALAVYDLRWFLLPDKIVFPLIGLALLQLGGRVIFYGMAWHEVVGAFLGALIMSGLFYGLFQLSKGAWIGGGDVKLALALGLLAGTPLRSLLVIFVASVAGTLVALPLMAMGKAKRKTQLPFGPLLIIGLITVELFGGAMLNWYTHLVVG